MIDLEGVACVADIGRVQAEHQGSAAALTFEGRATTFAEVDAMASRFANALMASGAKTQERIGYLSKNTDHFPPFLLGACKARLTLAPFNFRLAAPEIARLIEDSGTRLLIVGPDVVELAEAAIASLPAKPRLIALGFDRQGFERHDVWAENASSSDPRLEADPEDDVVQLYTSGTTGLPKGVQLPTATTSPFSSSSPPRAGSITTPERRCSRRCRSFMSPASISRSSRWRAAGARRSSPTSRLTSSST